MTILGACDQAGSIDDEQAVGAATYAAVIARFVTPAANTEPPRVAFVTAVGDEPLSLDDQVAVIDALAATHDVRFVDEPGAAFDPDLPDAPPKDDGVLIGVGKISGESPHTVRVEVYTSNDRIDAQLVTLSWNSDSWQIDSVEPVEPEVLIGDE
jgi:hypothetical protein